MPNAAAAQGVVKIPRPSGAGKLRGRAGKIVATDVSKEATPAEMFGYCDWQGVSPGRGECSYLTFHSRALQGAFHGAYPQ